MTAAPSSTPAPTSRVRTEMHRRIDELDWAKTSVGPRHAWPQSLTSTIKTLLGSRYPMILLWGPELIQIYNEAYIKLIGDKHPEALGRSIRETQAESWDVIGPMIQEVMSKGVPNWVPAQCLPLERSGYREESYFSLSYSPVDDDRGEITGMLCVCSEVTDQVLGERRLELLRDLGIRAGETHSVHATCESIASVFGDQQLDVPFAILYLLDSSGQALLLERSAPDLADPLPLPARVELQEEESAAARPLLRALQGETVAFSLPAAEARLLGGPWSELVRQALAIPLRSSQQTPAFGVLVAGCSPNRALDESYASFYGLLGNQLSLAIRNAQAYEDERQRAESLLELDRVISDVMMPRLDGPGLLRELREDERTSTVPVLLPPARAGEEAEVAGLETGADDHLVKPVSALELLTRVRSRLELANLRRENIEAAGRERGQRMLRFLADASATLAESLDYATTLARITRLAVPVLADLCFIDVVDESGVVARLHVAHADPADAGHARTLQQFPAAISSNRDNPPTRALREGQPVLLQDLTDDQLRASSHSEEHFALMRQLRIRSLMSVPLQARGRILGSLSLATSVSRRRYGPADLELAEDLARRCSLAVDNARLYAEAQRAISVRDEFLAVASHELRTPLTPLQLQLYVLERRARELARDERAADWLSSRLTVLRRQSVRLERLVNELLNVTELTRERFRLAPTPLDLAELVRDVLASFESSGELGQSGCSVELRLQQRVVGSWDRDHLAQVITYLLENALEFARGKPVLLELQRLDAAVRLSVTDQGPGIPLEDQARIFERFERAVPERQSGGLGLGLWLVRRMVQAMGGNIAVCSAAQRGATFSIELPIEPLPV